MPPRGSSPRRVGWWAGSRRGTFRCGCRLEDNVAVSRCCPHDSDVGHLLPRGRIEHEDRFLVRIGIAASPGQMDPHGARWSSTCTTARWFPRSAGHVPTPSAGCGEVSKPADKTIISGTMHCMAVLRCFPWVSQARATGVRKRQLPYSSLVHCSSSTHIISPYWRARFVSDRGNLTITVDRYRAHFPASPFRRGGSVRFVGFISDFASVADVPFVPLMSPSRERIKCASAGRADPLDNSFG